jgi:hypothetical protein
MPLPGLRPAKAHEKLCCIHLSLVAYVGQVVNLRRVVNPPADPRTQSAAFVRVSFFPTRPRVAHGSTLYFVVAPQAARLDSIPFGGERLASFSAVASSRSDELFALKRDIPGER